MMKATNSNPTNNMGRGLKAMAPRKRDMQDRIVMGIC
jgi:hypothetical protein